MAAEKRRCKWRGKRIAWCRKLAKFCDAPREYYTCPDYEPTQSDVLEKVQHNVDALRHQVFRVETKGSYGDIPDERMKEAARRFLTPFIRARGYLPQNPVAARNEISAALLEWETSKAYVSPETYEYIKAMLLDVDSLLEKGQVVYAILKMQAVWNFMMTKALGPPAKLPYIASPFPEGFPEEMKGCTLEGSWVQIPVSSQKLKNRFGSELRSMIFEGEREGREVGTMICQSASGELHLSRVCWGEKGRVRVTDCHDHLKPYGSFHVHIRAEVFSPEDLEQAIDREQLSCIGYMKSGIPTLKCIIPHKYYEYTPETKAKIRMALNEAAKDLARIRSDPNSVDARRLSVQVQRNLCDIEQCLDVYETKL